MAKGTPNAGINGTLANGLVAHYSFNDGSLADLSGNGNNLIATGNIYDIIDKDGQDYQAKTFPNGILQTPLNLQTELTLSIWYLVKNGTRNTNLLGFTDSSIFNPTTTDAIKFENNLIKAYCYDGGIKTLSSSDLLNGWYNIIATYKNNNYMRLYINKIFIGEILVANRSAAVDRVASKNIQSDAAIDEIRIYNRIITGKPINIREAATGEIAEIFDMGVNFKGDITPPTFNTINTSNVTANSVNLNINCSENATAYYKLYNKNETAPTPAELKTTHDGTITLVANTSKSQAIIGLNSYTDYDLYVVAEDTSGNLQTNVTKLSFTTVGNINFDTTNKDFYDIKLRNENTGEYIGLYGKLKVKQTTFGHNVKDNIYGDTIQTWVKIRNEIELTIDRIEEDFYDTLLKWWEIKAKVRIESNNKIPYLCNFIDTDLDLNDDYDEENNVTVYNGNVKFR